VASEPEPISPERLAWLEAEATRWRVDGLIEDEAAAAITARYRAKDRRTPVGLVVVLGFLLVAVGLVLLVASNVELDEVGPLARFLGVAAIWLALVAAAELGVERVAALRVLVGPLRVLVVVAYGATILQATQSLQVPAFSAAILVAWAVGSLAYAYAVVSYGAEVLGIAIGAAWYVFVMVQRGDTGAGVVLGLALPVPLLLAVGMAHAPTTLAALGRSWRGLAALLGLAGLFAGAIPGVVSEPDIPWAAWVVLVLGLIGVAVCAARGDADDRFEAAVGAAAAAAALVLVAVAPGETTDVFSGESPSGAQVAFALLGIATFVAAALAVAILGVRRRSPRITDAASGALFLFLLVQSFGVLAPLASGAALVLGLGVVLVAGGVLVDRGRRRLRAEAGG